MHRFRYAHVVAGLFVAVLGSCIVVEGREIDIKNFKLDVVFLVDQSKSMPSTNYKDMITAIGEWATSFLDTKNADKAQFAVIACNPTEPSKPGPDDPPAPSDYDYVPHPEMYYNLTKTTNVIELKKALERTFGATEQYWGDWLDFCTFYAVNYTLVKPEFGHRNDATVVAIYVTDCDVYENQINFSKSWNRSHDIAFGRLYEETKATLFFLCACYTNTTPCQYKIEWAIDGWLRWQNVLNILSHSKQGNESIMLFKDQDLDEQMSKIIPYGKLNVTDCVFRNDSGPCQLGNDARCWKSVKMTPIGNGTVLNEGIVVINDSERPRQCPKDPIIDIKEHCECPEVTTPGELAVKPMTIVQIMLPIVGVLLIVIVMLVVVAIFAKRRKKRAVLNKCQRDIVKKEKDQEIGANMTVCLSATKPGEFSTRTLASKGDKSAKGRKQNPMESARSAVSKNKPISKWSKSHCGKTQSPSSNRSKSKPSKSTNVPSKSGNPKSSALKKHSKK